ncbi:hypothetical protein D9Q98_005659 [Chlorella vulgaris]|uniref:Nonsense-mediated mRNA decay factor SMG8 n=1 Tax=Chlorella vulgaris TaxID=3077 RepID=A0A9D4TMN1_CHLVU|nr:hypothetical protein D9Q98_005659 [Chlorella vulgaris]
MFVVALIGDTLPAVCSALNALAGCSLHHALQLPQQAALQPEGWLAGRCCCYLDDASDTLWVGLAAAVVLNAADAALTRQEVRECEAEATRALLVAFLTSHAVLWIQPAPALRSTILLAQLRLLQQLKAALLPALPGLLGVPAAGANAAVPGLCVPQLLLLVQPPPARAAALYTEEATQHPLPMLLKRCRVLQPEESGARALCTLPVVLLLPEQLGCETQEQLVAQALAELVSPPPPQHRSAPAAVAAALAPRRTAVAALVAVEEEAAGAAQWARWQHAVATLASVLEAAAAAQPVPGAVVAKVATTAAASGPAAAACVEVPPEAVAAASWQAACSSAVWDFSRASCKRAAAVASDAYRRNTPALLPAGGHAVALQAALRLYRSLSRGPAAEAGAAALQQQLDAYWQEGHMQCSAVSFLGNPCCLPAHDPKQQDHACSSSGGTPRLLLASGSGAQQHAIPEPFTVAELQRAAAAVASDSGSAVARAHFYVQMVSPLASGAGAARDGPLPAADSAGRAAAGGGASRLAVVAGLGLDSAAAGGEAEAEAEAEAAEGGRAQLSGDRHSSDGESEAGAGAGAEAGAGTGAPGWSSGPTPAADAAGAPSGEGPSAAAAAVAAAAGLPAAGCWLELHLLGPRSMWKSPALASALLMDSQPGWLRGGGVMLASLPVQVAVPLKPGQSAARQSAAASHAAATAAAAAAEGDQEDEEFPQLLTSVQTAKQQAQQRQLQRRQRAGAKEQQQGKGGVATSAADDSATSLAESKAAAVQLPALLTWPGWQTAGTGAPQRAPLSATPAAGKQRQPRQQAPSKHPQRGSGSKLQLVGANASTAAAAAAATGVLGSSSAAAAVAAGTASTEQATVLLGAEYESAEGQRLLLTPDLLAAALQSSLDRVSVRQHSTAPAMTPATPASRSHTLQAAAAAAQVPAAGTAAFLLQQDLPVWLQLPADQLLRLAGSSKRRSGSGAPAAPSDCLAWLQLRRLFIATPEVAVQLEADPQLYLEVPRSMLAPASGEAFEGSASSEGSTSAAATLQLQYRLAAPLPLPTASFCVLALPWLLTAPMLQGPAEQQEHKLPSAPAALIRPSGPLRALLARHTAVRPKGLAN